MEALIQLKVRIFVDFVCACYITSSESSDDCV